jgi:hypothetical protein
MQISQRRIRKVHIVQERQQSVGFCTRIMNAMLCRRRVGSNGHGTVSQGRRTLTVPLKTRQSSSEHANPGHQPNDPEYQSLLIKF